MIDLVAFFAETAAAVQQPEENGFPVFPVSRDPKRPLQHTEDKSFSRNSRISRRENSDMGPENFETQQDMSSVPPDARAREYRVDGREMRELREMPANAGASISRSLSLKREIKRETGNPGHLPAPDGLALWRAGLARLDPARPPCPGYRINDRTGAPSGEWSRVLARAVAFLDEFGEQAEALGWTAPRLFGVHAEVGIVRVDVCGALVLPIGGAVRAITATEISFGHLTHREKAGQTQGPPFWEIGSGRDQD